MSTSPFIGLPVHLLEKIVTKLEFFSYIRMQQTCRNMAEIVRSNPKIKVFVAEYYDDLKWETDDDGSLQCIPFEPRNDYDHWMGLGDAALPWRNMSKIDIESLYGLRFASISLPGAIEMFFEDISTLHGKYRITSKSLPMNSRYSHNRKLSKDQFLAFCEVIKPVEAVMDDLAESHYETVFEIEKIKNVTLTLDPDEALFWIRRFVAQLEKVSIELSREDFSSNYDHALDFMYSLLEILLKENLTNLYYFRFNVLGHVNIPPFKVLEIFSEFNIEKKEDGSSEYIMEFGEYNCLIGYDVEHAYFLFEKS